MWEEGGPMFDLNTVIPPGSGLQLTNAININDHGEILAESVVVTDADIGRLVLLVPCDEERDDCVNVLSSSPESPQVLSPAPQRRGSQQPNAQDAMRAWRERFTSQHGRTFGHEY
jgi:hypothetical protein